MWTVRLGRTLIVTFTRSVRQRAHSDGCGSLSKRKKAESQRYSVHNTSFVLYTSADIHFLLSSSAVTKLRALYSGCYLMTFSQPAASDEMKRNFVDESVRLRTSYSQSFGLKKNSNRSLSGQTFCGLGNTLKRPDHCPFLYYLHRTFRRYVTVVGSALKWGQYVPLNIDIHVPNSTV